jgi:predicted nucleic acid-binding Zn ribbon protein
MIKRDNTYTLKEAIEQLVRAYGYQDKLLESTLISSWEKVVGSVYAAHTDHLKVKNRTLFVKIDSPALRQELSMQKSDLLKKLNRKTGKKVIDDIVFR